MKNMKDLGEFKNKVAKQKHIEYYSTDKDIEYLAYEICRWNNSNQDNLSSKLGLFTDFNSYVLTDNNVSYILKFNWTIQKWTVKMVDMNEDISFYEVIGE